MENREQKLVDICFQLVLTATDKRNQKFFSEKDNEEKAEWVSDQLAQCGFKTTPCGASWGILEKE